MFLLLLVRWPAGPAGGDDDPAGDDEDPAGDDEDEKKDDEEEKKAGNAYHQPSKLNYTH